MEILQNFILIIKTASIMDILDIVIVAYLIYKALKFIHGTSVENGLKGVLMLAIVMVVSGEIGLNIINFVLRNTLQIGLIALLVLFQPELRKVLEQVGNTKITQILKRETAETEIHIMIREVVDACSSMSWSRTGALIVFERKTRMDDIITAATTIDAKTTSELVKNIFFVKAPLHDGAMIIRDGRISAAGCVLPLSENETLAKELGTRHRAGIGISEHTDALSVIVSEETGIISTAIGGQIKRNLSPEALENLLKRELVPAEPDKDVKKTVRKMKSIWKGLGK